MNIIELLRNEVPTRIKFTKADGSTRVMWATLNSKWLPPVDPDAKPSTKVRPEGTFAVFEIDNGWRSFKIENLLEIASYHTLERAKEHGLVLKD